MNDVTERPGWRQWAPPVAALAVFAAVLIVIDHELSGFHLRDVLRYLRSIPARSVMTAIAGTVTSFLLLSTCDLLGLRYVGRRLPYRRVAFNSAIAYAFGHSMGAAALTAGAVRYRLYSMVGLNGVEVATVQGFCSSATAFGLVLLVGASLVVAPQPAAAALQPFSGGIGIALLMLVGGYLAWGSLARSGLEIRGWVLRPAGPKLTILQVLIGSADLCVATSVLWLLLPDTLDISFFTFVGIYALAVTGGIVSHVPGGLGVFESIVLVSLPDAPADSLLGAILAYRAIYYILPLLLASTAFASQEVSVQGARLARLETFLSRYITPLAPRLGGALIFITGLVLLISGATPAIDARLAALRHVMPLSVVEASHLLGSIAGLGLLILSRGLFRRVHEAYRLTSGLLAAGIAASLLKGLDFEEATLLALALAFLWLGRRAFYRSASVIDERLTPTWIVSILGVLAAVLWIGMFAYRHLEFSTDLWWTFSFSANAPRMLRASLVTAVVAGAAFALNLLRPARPEPGTAGPADIARVRRTIANSGATLANAALTGDKRLLLAPEEDAFIMYQLSGRSWIALGDPIGERARCDELAWRFRELADRHGGWTVFYQVGSDRLPLYIDLGLTPMKIGEEARVPLDHFDLEGSARADLRQSHRRAQRDRASFEVVSAASIGPLLPALRRISDAWLREKATAEKGFSVGAFEEAYIRNFPVAIVRRDGEPVAFANLWTTERKDELSVDLMRFSDDAPHSAMDFLFIELMLWGRAGGYRSFDLGMAPLAGLETHPLAPSWHRIGNFIFRHGEHFYNFDGLRRYKAKFDPVWEPKYLVSPAGWMRVPRILMDVSRLVAGGVKGMLSK